jgi:predicted acylesterase/phospholipase RssA
MTIEHKADLVLEGGGVKGAGLVGALAALNDAGLREVGRVQVPPPGRSSRHS